MPKSLKIKIFVPGLPVPKDRPRVVRNPKTGRITTFTPQRTRHWESYLRMYVKSALNDREGLPLRGPLAVTLVFTFKRPKKPSRPYPVKCGDVENLSKAVCDALNGVLYDDDTQIVSLELHKRFLSLGKSEGDDLGVDIEIKELDPALL